MDSIDITDATFALSNTVTGGGVDSSSYMNYLYMGLGITLLLVLVYYLFKKCPAKSNGENCEGGFCTMGNDNTVNDNIMNDNEYH